jgi:hypothetical protein
MMHPAMDNPASCKIHAFIHFLYAKNMNAAEICHQICAVYRMREFVHVCER